MVVVAPSGHLLARLEGLQAAERDVEAIRHRGASWRDVGDGVFLGQRVLDSMEEDREGAGS